MNGLEMHDVQATGLNDLRIDQVRPKSVLDLWNGSSPCMLELSSFTSSAETYGPWSRKMDATRHLLKISLVSLTAVANCLKVCTLFQKGKLEYRPLLNRIPCGHF